jgi:hypothetical protein
MERSLVALRFIPMPIYMSTYRHIYSRESKRRGRESLRECVRERKSESRKRQSEGERGKRKEGEDKERETLGGRRVKRIAI